MLTFTVHEPPNPPADRVDRAEGLVFIKDGFAWFAALFAPLWLLMHRLWWALLGYVALAAALQLAQKFGVLTETTTGLMMLALNLLVGFEAGTLRRWALDRKAGACWAPPRAVRSTNASGASSTAGCPRSPS